MTIIDTLNKYFVGVQGDDIVILMPISKMSKEDALVFAGWIVTLADDSNKFADILAAVRGNPNGKI